MKELLIEREYKDMDKQANNNLREYLLTMESENQPQAYEQDNYYLIKYYLLDLRSLETLALSEKILYSELEQEIPDQLAKIIHETNFSISPSTKLSYKALINNNWLSSQYLFEAIPLSESISSLKELLILPSSERAIIHYLHQINYNLDNIWGAIAEHGDSINTSLNNIDKALDLMNYLAQH